MKTTPVSAVAILLTACGEAPKAPEARGTAASPTTSDVTQKATQDAAAAAAGGESVQNDASMKPNTRPDADADGVADALDRCPGTAARAKVDARGCEKNSDGDGIADSRDACANTASGVDVDARGCRLRLTDARSFALDIDFATNSATTVGEATELLEDAVALLRTFPETPQGWKAIRTAVVRSQPTSVFPRRARSRLAKC